VCIPPYLFYALSLRWLITSASARGSFSLVSPTPTGSSEDTRIGAWMAHGSFNGPHSGVIRSVYWDEDASILLSGGEDGTLCAWPCPPTASDGAEMEVGGGLGGRGVVREESVEMDVDSPKAKRVRRDEHGTASHVRPVCDAEDAILIFGFSGRQKVTEGLTELQLLRLLPAIVTSYASCKK
jgi:hypothetical protein